MSRNHLFTKVTLVTLTLDLQNTKSIGIKILPRPISMFNMKTLSQTVLKIMRGNRFFHERDHSDIDC